MQIKKIYLIPFLGLLCACNNSSTSNSTLKSNSIGEKNDRIRTLSKYVTFKSDVLDCEFELFNVNGFGNERLDVPGASSLNYKFGLIVNKSDISKWTNNLRDTVISNPDYTWIIDLINNRPQNWSLHSKPKFYVGDSIDGTFVVYENEGVIFRRITNL